MKKAIVALILVALVAVGGFGQIILGLSGALHTDTELTGHQINDRFKNGEGIFYGPYGEIVFDKLGLGLAANFSRYSMDTSTVPGFPATMDMTDYDIVLYLSYHLFGGRAFLDPFGELGYGIMATGFANSSDQDKYDPFTDKYLAASYYWYAALGMGVNLGGIGLFGKFSYNYSVGKDFETEWNTANTGYTGKTTMQPYGYDSVLFPKGYLPKYRITFGAKLIL